MTLTNHEEMSLRIAEAIIHTKSIITHSSGAVMSIKDICVAAVGNADTMLNEIAKLTAAKPTPRVEPSEGFDYVILEDGKS